MTTAMSGGRWWARLAAAELPLVLLVAPVLLFPTPHRLPLVLAIPVCWLGARLSGGSWIPATPLNTPLLVLLGMTGVSLWATSDVMFSLGKVSGVLLGVVFFWAVTRWTTTAARLRAAVAAFVGAGAGLAILGLLGTNWIDKFPAVAAIVAHLPHVIRGIPGAEEGFHPNAVAGGLLLFVPVQVGLLTASMHIWWTPSGRSGPAVSLSLQALLLGLTAGTLVLTQSRGAGASLVVAGGAVLAWLAPRTRVLVAAAVAGGVVFTLALGPERVLESAMRQSGAGIDNRLATRTELWTRALDGIQDFPLTGMGMNTFRKIPPAQYRTRLGAADVDIAHAHNHLLQAALDLGLPGLVSYLALWLGTAGLLVRVYRLSGDRFYRVVAGGLGAGLIAHFAFGMTDAIPLGAKVGLLFWMTLALAVSLHQVAVGRFPFVASGFSRTKRRSAS